MLGAFAPMLVMYSLLPWEWVAFPNSTASNLLVALNANSRSATVWGVFGTGAWDTSETRIIAAMAESTIAPSLPPNDRNIDPRPSTIKNATVKPKHDAYSPF